MSPHNWAKLFHRLDGGGVSAGTSPICIQLHTYIHIYINTDAYGIQCKLYFRQLRFYFHSINKHIGFIIKILILTLIDFSVIIFL